MDYKNFPLYPSEWGIVGNDSCGFLQIVNSCDNSEENDHPTLLFYQLIVVTLRHRFSLEPLISLFRCSGVHRSPKYDMTVAAFT